MKRVCLFMTLVCMMMVSCKPEPEKPEGPVVITSGVTDITITSAVCGGEVVSGGDAVIVARGVCYNTTGTPTVSDIYTMDGTNIGSFTSILSNLELNTTYYVRAYATDAKGVTSYGEEVSFTTLEKLLPVVTTAEVTDITISSATCGGEVTFDGNVAVTARGICWGTSPNPTIEKDNKINNGSGTGSFKSYMSGLKDGTTYYVRAYATNEKGTAYGEEKSFTTLELLLPTVMTENITNIKTNSARSGGNVSSDGNGTVTARGICWSTSQNPTIEDNKTTDGTGVGNFTSNLSNLEHNTTYYVRAYATNEVGTAYGEEVSFTTLERTFENGYEYVDLGLSVKWATCNVGATTPEEYGDYFAWGETTTKETYTEDNCATYNVSMNDISGNAQYDAATANWGGDWRMPTYDELNELINNCTWTWTTQNGVNGYNVEGPNGNSIFLPAAGYRNGSSLYYAGGYGFYWSSTPGEYLDFNAYYLYFSSDYHIMDYYYRFGGLSVRPVLE